MVVFVTVGRDQDQEDELTQRTGEVYKRTSYNTKCGVYYDPETNNVATDQSKAFRKNFAGLGYMYDPVRDAFISPKPYSDWVLNETTCCWEPPTPYPSDGQNYYWDETNHAWINA